ncbi:MAG TPA: ATP synthase F1 subunit delta [Flavitalea sp.]|nr:ATP synthase F1 subunit delta [Flavitalea sp.]
MLNPRLAGRYAKSLLMLAIEKNQLDTAHHDMQFLNAVSKANKEFVVVLKSPVISPEKKEAIIQGVTKGKISDLTFLFIRLLIRKGREMNLPEIATAFIDQYNEHEKIYRVQLTTASPVSDEVKQEIVNQVKKQTSLNNIELTAAVDESLIGGFILQIGNTMVDASIAYDLNVIKQQFLNNDFIYKIR